MIWRLSLVFIVVASIACAEGDPALEAIKAEVRKIAEEVREQDVPELLIASLDASSGNVHPGDMLLHDAGLTSGLSLNGLAHKIAVNLMLKEALSPREITAGFAIRAYYGRRCYGWRAASAGLMGIAPDEASDISLVTLAALTVAPSNLSRDRRRLRKRVEAILESLAEAGHLTTPSAQRLLDSPVPRLGSGC